MNIILIGMRGSGKSTIARKLSKKLNKPYIEIDRLIAQEAGMAIPEMVAHHGWEYFRETETAVTKRVCEQDDVIISTGGGVITKPENIAALQKNSKIFYLRANIYTLLQRIGKDATRPALTANTSLADEMKEVLQNRKLLYESTATSIIDTEKKSVNTVVKEILTHL
jgi:shikimate kinase